MRQTNCCKERIGVMNMNQGRVEEDVFETTSAVGRINSDRGPLGGILERKEPMFV